MALFLVLCTVIQCASYPLILCVLYVIMYCMSYKVIPHFLHGNFSCFTHRFPVSVMVDLVYHIKKAPGFYTCISCV